MAQVRLLVLTALVTFFVVTRAEELPNNDDFLELGPEDDLSPASLMEFLFHDEDNDDTDSAREARADDGVDPAKELSKFTNFVDILFRRMNPKLRNEADPLSLNLAKKASGKKGKGKTSKKNKKAKKPKSKKTKDKKPEPKDDKESKAKRHPKDLELVEEESLHREAREVGDHEPVVQEELVVVEVPAESGRESRVLEPADDSQIASRMGKPSDKGKKDTKKSNKGKSSKSSSSRATLKGLASIQRSGEIKLLNLNRGKKIRADFVIGPVELSMSRTVGSKEKEVMTASAVAPKLEGVMYIEVSANGNANVKDVNFKKPEGVKTVGSLTRDSSKRSGKDGVQRGLLRSRPIVQKKIRLLAQQVLRESRKN